MDFLNRVLSLDSIAGGLATLSLAVTLGLALGSIQIRGLKLGISGVLFSSLLFGQVGLTVDPNVLSFLRDFSLILYAYTIGLQVGPGFVDSLKAEGLRLNLLSIAVLVIGAGMTFALVAATHLLHAYSPGLYAGAFTTTPGPGVGTQLGMTNDYNYANGEGPGATANCDITSVSTTAFGTVDTWRIRGNSNSKNAGAGNANGWNNSAPNYTQGAEFAVSTVGYSNIIFSFDWFCTTQGVGNMQIQYTTNGTNWNNLGSDYLATANDEYGGAGATEPNLTVSVPSAGGDANFAVRVVSVKPVVGDSDYSATGPGGDGNYAAASGDTSSATAVDYNNNSGNWSFGNITIAGTAAVPEPASAGLLALGAMMTARRRGRRSTIHSDRRGCGH